MNWKDYGNEKAEFLYHTPDEWELSEKLWTVRGGQTITKPGYQAGPKRMDGYSIHIVKEGRLLFESGSGGRQFLLRNGDLFCMFPGRTYYYRRPGNCSKLLMSWIVVEGPGTEELLQAAGLTPDEPCLPGRFDAAMQSALDDLFQLMRSGSGADSGEGLRHSLAMQSALLHFFFALLAKDDGARRPESRDWVRRSLRYADLHAAEGLTVEQLAAIVGMNRNYFSTAFAQRVGVSPSQYLAKARMTKAAEMLKESSASVTEIAYSLGYANPFAFTRAFTRHYGMPPTAYREKAPRE